MRSRFVTKLGPLLLLLFVACAAWTQTSVDSHEASLASARLLLKNGDFKGAAAAFRQLNETRPSAEAYAGLVQSLLKQDEVKAADESSRAGLSAFPDSAITHAARGDVQFRRGLIPDAENEFDAALKIDPKSARAWLGQGRVDAALSRRAKAKAAVAKAHELDPDDGDALYEWAVRQPYPLNIEGLEKHLAEFHNDPETDRREREFKDFLNALAGRKVWVPARQVPRAEINLESLPMGPGMSPRGYGVRVRLNDRATVTLMLDTGASGVIITRKLAEKVGAHKLSEQALEGLGKSGVNAGYKAWVDKVVIGNLEFHDCFIHATPHEIAEVDGTIGGDVFSNYLVSVDFSRQKLRLEPLPPASDGAENSASGSFAQAYTFGHLLLVSTEAGKKASGLFIIDTGANINTITPELGKSVPDMHASNLTMSGASGQVSSAFFTNDATLVFAKTRKTGATMSTVDLHAISKDLGVEVSGQIGFNAMWGKKSMTINYRDGLVEFEGK
ncbi:MAG TPA: aspartyl protease family protein [Candidatus Angelobacter sp.]|nr:aspartyl protease family protein [Candidatus Angelobacter sp.]